EHYHEYETRNSFSPPQKEQQHEGDSIQTETCMSDDEDEEENIGSTSHVTRKETRALGETRNLLSEYPSIFSKMEEDKKKRRKREENDFRRFPDKLSLDKKFGGPL
ncbi:hypothetical protein Tco_1425217, partial [Tanacetum coccineum]